MRDFSYQLDALRSEIRWDHPALQIVDSTYYGVDTFTLCEANPYVLITQAIYADIHPNLVTIPLAVPYTMPYGLIYANKPTHPPKNSSRLPGRAGHCGFETQQKQRETQYQTALSAVV